MPIGRFFPDRVLLAQFLFHQSQLQDVLGHINHAGINSIVVHIRPVLTLPGLYQPVGQTCGLLQVFHIPVGGIFVHQQVDGARRVLDAGGMVLGLHLHRVVQQVEQIVEAAAQLLVQLLFREKPGRLESGIEAIPTLDVRGSFLVILPGIGTGLLQRPLPRSVGGKDAFDHLVPLHGTHGIKTHLGQCAGNPLHVVRPGCLLQRQLASLVIADRHHGIRGQDIKRNFLVRAARGLRHPEHRHPGQPTDIFFKLLRPVNIHQSDGPRPGFALLQHPQVLRMAFGQGQGVHQVEIQRLDAMSHEPMGSRILIAQVVLHAPRCHGLGRHDAQRMSGRRLQVAIEMRLLATHQGREILAEPVGILLHIRVDAQAQAGLFGLERHVSLVYQGHLQRRLSFPRLVRQATLHVVYHSPVGTVTVRHPFRGLRLSVPHGIEGRSHKLPVRTKEGHRVVPPAFLEHDLLQAAPVGDAGFPIFVFPNGGLGHHTATPQAGGQQQRKFLMIVHTYYITCNQSYLFFTISTICRFSTHNINTPDRLNLWSRAGRHQWH